VTSNDPFELTRFLEAQQDVFDRAFAEVRNGRKESHWMWFIFPQMAGLGQSATSRRFAIRSLDEAKSYLSHPVLGSRLRQSVEALLHWAGVRDAQSIFGPVDAAKLRSSLTLFSVASPGEALFRDALAAFYESPDPQTLRLLDAA
jgi:uncharacterized protein (DUF1810 family)